MGIVLLQSLTVSPDVTKHCLHHLLTWETFILTHFGQGRVDTSSSLCISALLVLTERNMLQRICLLLCVYTVYATHGSTHAGTHNNICIVFPNTQVRKILCVGWNIDWRDQRAFCIWSWEALFQLQILSLPSPISSLSLLPLLLIVFWQSFPGRKNSILATFQTSEWQQHIAQRERLILAEDKSTSGTAK